MKPVRLHYTNVVGLGALRLLQSLLLPLTLQANYRVVNSYVPGVDNPSAPLPATGSENIHRYRRWLPNALSRFLECSVFGRKFDGDSPLLVLGDIPLRCKSRQTVFVQTTLLTQGQDNARKLGAVKYWISRWLFRRNQRFASAFIVQTEWMKGALVATYPEIQDRVHVVTPPVPDWLTSSGLKRVARNTPTSGNLRLFYPAAAYPHKNHKLLGEIRDESEWPVSELTLTIPTGLNPNPSAPWIRCVGHLGTDDVLKAYTSADALLFLSFTESYGFPLVEAMTLGLPVLCPNLAYARALCGNEAVYFDPYDIASLQAAVLELKRRVDAGWWPDWSDRLKNIPRDWNEVALRMLQVTCGERSASENFQRNP